VKQPGTGHGFPANDDDSSALFGLPRAAPPSLRYGTAAAAFRSMRRLA
jgi:hypothetical protein